MNNRENDNKKSNQRDYIHLFSLKRILFEEELLHGKISKKNQLEFQARFHLLVHRKNSLNFLHFLRNLYKFNVNI